MRYCPECNAIIPRAETVDRERDACATLADEMADRYDKNAANPNERGSEMRHTALVLRALASAIRARGRHQEGT